MAAFVTIAGAALAAWLNNYQTINPGPVSSGFLIPLNHIAPVK